MFQVLVLVALLLPSLTYSAARSPAAPPPETKQTAASGGLEDKEEKAGAAIDSSGIVGAAGQRFFATMTGPKGSVSLLGTLAAQQLLAGIDEKVLQACADELVRIWTSSPPEINFEALFGRSQEIINKLFPELSGIIVTDELSDILYAPIISLLLQNSAIREKILQFPLSTIGNWPSPIKEESIIFNENGYIAARSDKELYLFNCTNHTMLKIDEPLLSGPERKWMFFSSDGSAIAVVIKSEVFFRLFIFDTVSGRAVHPEKPKDLRSFSASPVAPLFMYIDHDYNAVIYDCVAKKITAEYPTLREGETMMLPPTISPRGNFSGCIVKNTDIDNIYVQNNHTLLRYPLIGPMEEKNLLDTAFFIDFNTLETMVGIIDPRDGKYKIFRLDNLSETQLPYYVVKRSHHKHPDIEYDVFNYQPRFSPDGTQLLIRGWLKLPGFIPTSAEEESFIVDLNTKETLENFGRIYAKFLSQNIIRLTKPSSYYNAGDGEDYLYVRDKKQRIALPPDSGDLMPIHEKTMKIAFANYRQHCIYIFDIRNQRKFPIDKGARSFGRWNFDAQGIFFCAGDRNIEQLMIDFTDCSLNQIFFLLGLVRASREGILPTSLAQLLASPILVTFSPEAQRFLTATIEKKLPFKAPVFPSNFMAPAFPPSKKEKPKKKSMEEPIKEEPKKVASAHPRGSNKKNQSKKRVVA